MVPCRDTLSPAPGPAQAFGSPLGWEENWPPGIWAIAEGFTKLGGWGKMLQADVWGWQGSNERKSGGKIWRRRPSSGQLGQTHSGGSQERLAPEFPASGRAARTRQSDYLGGGAEGWGRGPAVVLGRQNLWLRFQLTRERRTVNTSFWMLLPSSCSLINTIWQMCSQ